MTSMSTAFRYTISPYNDELYQKESSSKENIINLRLYLDKRFGNWCYTERGRTAIFQALSFYNLEPDDVVTIFTTSGNFYISGCVTREIEKFCRWSRKMERNTKLIFINHEFGYPYKHPESLLKYDLPIIEDCAYGFFTEDPDGKMGEIGDFVIYSLSKAFSSDFGGILKCNDSNFKLSTLLPEEDVAKLDTHISAQIQDIAHIKSARLKNYKMFFENLHEIGIEPYFKLEDGVVPGVILFQWKDTIDYPKLKQYMQDNGVESTVFYGKPAFYLPIHQNFDEGDINNICGMISNFQTKKI